MTNRKKEPAAKEADVSDFIGGTINILGLKMDLGNLLSSPEKMEDQLEKLREKLRDLGGKEVLTEEEWKAGKISVSGEVKTHGILGEREYHIGTTAGPSRRARPERPPREAPEVVEPPADVFDEAQQVIIVAEVPGVGQEDLEITIAGKRVSISTKPTAPRGYKKVVELSSTVEPESLQSICRNGVLEIRLQKKAKGSRPQP